MVVLLVPKHSLSLRSASSDGLLRLRRHICRGASARPAQSKQPVGADIAGSGRAAAATPTRVITAQKSLGIPRYDSLVYASMITKAYHAPGLWPGASTYWSHASIYFCQPIITIGDDMNRHLKNTIEALLYYYSASIRPTPAILLRAARRI